MALQDAAMHDWAQRLRAAHGIDTERAEALVLAAVAGDRAELARLGFEIPGAGPVSDIDLGTSRKRPEAELEDEKPTQDAAKPRR